MFLVGIMTAVRGIQFFTTAMHGHYVLSLCSVGGGDKAVWGWLASWWACDSGKIWPGGLLRSQSCSRNLDSFPPFFICTEMAEHHNAQEILQIARELVCRVQTLIENKWAWVMGDRRAKTDPCQCLSWTWMEKQLGDAWHYHFCWYFNCIFHVM